MTRAVTAAAAAATLVGAGAALNATAAPQATTLHVGDRVTVEGQPIGCRVARQGGHVVMDCRRGGQLAGTYGTMLSARGAKVVRFHDNSVAKVVYTAQHGGGARRCD